MISGGLSEFDAATDESAHDVFGRADALMYEEKRRLKELGAVTRDDAEDGEEELISELNAGQEIINVRRHILVVEDELVNQMLLGNALEEGFEVLYAPGEEDVHEHIPRADQRF